MCVFGYVKTQGGNAGWLAGWLAARWLSVLLSVWNVIFTLAAQGPSVCRACCSLCGDQRDPQNSLHTEEVTQPDLTQLSRAYYSSLRPLRTQRIGPDGTRLSKVVYHRFSSGMLPSVVWLDKGLSHI